MSAPDDEDLFDFGLGTLVMYLATSLAFLLCWGYAIHEYGWFIGLAFGWIPSAIIGIMLFGLTWVLFIYIPQKARPLLFLSRGAAILIKLCVWALIFFALYGVYRVARFLGLLG